MAANASIAFAILECMGNADDRLGQLRGVTAAIDLSIIEPLQHLQQIGELQSQRLSTHQIDGQRFEWGVRKGVGMV